MVALIRKSSTVLARSAGGLPLARVRSRLGPLLNCHSRKQKSLLRSSQGIGQDLSSTSAKDLQRREEELQSELKGLDAVLEQFRAGLVRNRIEEDGVGGSKSR